MSFFRIICALYLLTWASFSFGDDLEQKLHTIANQMANKSFPERDKATKQWITLVQNIKTVKEGVAVARWYEAVLATDIPEELRLRLALSEQVVSRLGWYSVYDKIQNQKNVTCAALLEKGEILVGLADVLNDENLPFDQAELLVEFFKQKAKEDGCVSKLKKILEPTPPRIWKSKLLVTKEFDILKEFGSKEENTLTARWENLVFNDLSQNEVVIRSAEIVFYEILIKNEAAYRINTRHHPKSAEYKKLVEYLRQRFFAKLQDLKTPPEQLIPKFYFYVTTANRLEEKELAALADADAPILLEHLKLLRGKKTLPIVFEFILNVSDITKYIEILDIDSANWSEEELSEILKFIPLRDQNIGVQKEVYSLLECAVRKQKDFPINVIVLLGGPKPDWDLFNEIIKTVENREDRHKLYGMLGPYQKKKLAPEKIGKFFRKDMNATLSKYKSKYVQGISEELLYAWVAWTEFFLEPEAGDFKITEDLIRRADWKDSDFSGQEIARKLGTMARFNVKESLRLFEMALQEDIAQKGKDVSEPDVYLAVAVSDFIEHISPGDSLPIEVWDYVFEKVLAKKDDREKLFVSIFHSSVASLDKFPIRKFDARFYALLNALVDKNPALAFELNKELMRNLPRGFWDRTLEKLGAKSADLQQVVYDMNTIPAPLLKDIIELLAKKAFAKKFEDRFRLMIQSGRIISYDEEGNALNAKIQMAHP